MDSVVFERSSSSTAPPPGENEFFLKFSEMRGTVMAPLPPPLAAKYFSCCCCSTEFSDILSASTCLPYCFSRNDEIPPWNAGEASFLGSR